MKYERIQDLREENAVGGVQRMVLRSKTDAMRSRAD